MHYRELYETAIYGEGWIGYIKLMNKKLPFILSLLTDPNNIPAEQRIELLLVVYQDPP